MLKTNFISMLGGLLLLAVSVYAKTDGAQRIHFARGTWSKTLTVQLSQRKSDDFYVVRTSAGQQMSVKVTAAQFAGGIVPDVTVISPSGHSSAEEKTKAQRIDFPKTEAGDYQIRVATNLMASNGTQGKVRLKVWIR